LIGGDIPASAGLMEPIEVIAPPGTVVNANHPASVAGGNVETSQRIVDTVFKALSQAIPDRIPAASQGTMNNLTIGGIDPRSGSEFSYYETVAGGMGARPKLDGMSATHTHMTNSLNTPAEALEYAYPLRVREYRIRKDSGGKGRHKGGDGAIREIETLASARMSLLTDRRSARRMVCAAAKMASVVAPSSFVVMELAKNWLPKEVGRSRPAIACGLKRRAAADLGSESADYTDFTDERTRKRKEPARAFRYQNRFDLFCVICVICGCFCLGND